MTAEQERAAVVAMLEKEATELDVSAGIYGGRGIWHVASDFDRQAKYYRHIKCSIQRGDHHK